MLKLFCIAFGGAFGAVLRYLASGWIQRGFNSSFPWGTMGVNLIGSFFIGLLWALSEATVIPQNIRMFVFVGVLGSFTTFSTFSLENFHLLRDGEYTAAAVNMFGSLFFGLVFVFLGYFLIRSLKGS